MEENMREKAINFLKEFGEQYIKYKISEYSGTVEKIPFDIAVNRFILDFNDFKLFGETLNFDESQAFDMTCALWKKHIIF